MIHHANNFSSIKTTVSIIYVAEVGSTILYFRAPNKLEIHYRLDRLKSDNENSDHFLSGIWAISEVQTLHQRFAKF